MRGLGILKPAETAPGQFEYTLPETRQGQTELMWAILCALSAQDTKRHSR